MSETQLNEQSTGTQAEPLSGVTQATSSPGAQLAAHRQARGFTIEQVANQLNLAPRQIQALEADNYAALPGVVIARGFIRAYAKLLKVDPAPLVSLMQGDVAPMESIQLKRALSAGSFSESRLPPTARNGLLSKWVIASALLVLIVVSVLAFHWFGLIPNLSESMSENIEKGSTFLSSSTNVTSSDHVNAMPDNAASTPPVNAHDISSSSRVTKDEVAAPITATAPTAAPVSANTPASAPTTATVPATTASAIAPAAPATLASPSPVASASADQGNLPAANKNMLVIKAREESWIEIKDANDRVLISRLMAADSTEMLSVSKPVFLTVGNAAGVDVTLRGKSVDLKSAAKNNVARLNLK